MKILGQEQFNKLITQANIKPRLKRELRFIASTAHMTPQDWEEAELLSVSDRNHKSGVLLLAPDEAVYVLPHELSIGIANRQTGRAQPVICDFCRTWQRGSSAASISFQKDRQSINSVGFLCCADLGCSDHVRGKASAARISRAQLREDMTNEQRVERLKTRLRQIIADLELEPALE
jgi:hypothetical protein